MAWIKNFVHDRMCIQWIHHPGHHDHLDGIISFGLVAMLQDGIMEAKSGVLFSIQSECYISVRVI